MEIEKIIKLFGYYKSLGEKTIDQIDDEEIHLEPAEDANSIAIIIKHLSGNMRSRWTNFLTEDGEKEWRNRDDEFRDTLKTKEEVMAKWEEGWQCLFDALNSLNEADLSKTIYIRNEGQLVVDAIHRQLAHYSYHVGQIVFLGKILKGDAWKSLSIPKGKSVEYNAEKFAQEKETRHFTDEV